MLKPYHPRIRDEYEDFADFLYEAWQDDKIDPDEFWQGSYPEDGCFAQFGRRVLVDDGSGYKSLSVETHKTIAEACEHMDRLHTDRPACEWDAILSQDRGVWRVSVEGTHVGTAKSYDFGVKMMATAMADMGCFPDAFEIDDRGGSHRIDNDVREWHDKGDVKMKDESHYAGRLFDHDGSVVEILDVASPAGEEGATTELLASWGGGEDVMELGFVREGSWLNEDLEPISAG